MFRCSQKPLNIHRTRQFVNSWSFAGVGISESHGKAYWPHWKQQQVSDVYIAKQPASIDFKISSFFDWKSLIKPFWFLPFKLLSTLKKGKSLIYCRHPIRARFPMSLHRIQWKKNQKDSGLEININTQHFTLLLLDNWVQIKLLRVLREKGGKI